MTPPSLTPLGSTQTHTQTRQSNLDICFDAVMIIYWCFVTGPIMGHGLRTAEQDNPHTRRVCTREQKLPTSAARASFHPHHRWPITSKLYNVCQQDRCGIQFQRLLSSHEHDECYRHLGTVMGFYLLCLAVKIFWFVTVSIKMIGSFMGQVMCFYGGQIWTGKLQVV